MVVVLESVPALVMGSCSFILPSLWAEQDSAPGSFGAQPVWGFSWGSWLLLLENHGYANCVYGCWVSLILALLRVQM